ncbi:GspE/PulE family protein [Bacillus suaedaesalsae]|uniref:Flp pilus assembly complex ATPase component TadA n=1 Tax=Bacillus suaedaesalsae TaxID=2810349 RepID=A0ABS2DMS0_9BACI|nr:ATPase, T2SS/T4P/T4SS family [Bacillus suaedaesalsae]MBM6619758.1 Flp pilus assembly complex ATPase component TadA [Bacillus suaedaesalsae]
MPAMRKRLGDLLIEAGLITEAQLEDALHTKKENQKLGDALLERGIISEQQLIEVLEVQLGISHISLYRYPIDASLMSLVQKDFARRNLLIPIKKEGNTLTVAMNDPMDYYAIDDLRLSTGFQISQVIAARDEILAAIGKYYNIEEFPEDFQVTNDVEQDGENAPAIRLVNQILTAGIQQKASDIHIDPHETKLLVRYRVDGLLRTERTLPKALQNVLTARIKIMANLNITETRLPQDGRIKLNLDYTSVDLRISILPTVFGEKVVIRVLDLSNALMKLSQMSFNKVNLQRFINLIERPSGMVLVTGPTGSGKTSTVYSAVNHINTEDVNIITIEDPVEYQVEGINQVQVNHQVGLTFANGLRSILRQDPNVVMVGEIRDAETAEIAIRASLTGHLVLSTMHTNSAIGTIPRLFDMGIEPFLVVSSLSGIVAQRLVRKICNECSVAHPPTEMEQNVFQKRGLKVEQVFTGRGCKACNDTGYKGRLAIHEVLVIDDQMRSMMMNNNSVHSLREYALRNGMIFLIDDGLLKVKQGLTTVQEVLRVALSD